MSCVLCGGQTTLIYSSPLPYSVSSDCRKVASFPDIYQCESCCHVQKIAHQEYQQAVAQLYASYDAYTLTQGKEPLKFSSEIPGSRTSAILQNVIPYINNHCGNWLDIGTGSGVMLHSVSVGLPNYTLWGQDISGHCQSEVMGIANVAGFYSGEIEQIDEKFDVVSAIHVLEHVFDPQQFVIGLKRLLTTNGSLIIQVPNVANNPFDVCVFDHVSHFNVQVLVRFLKKYFKYQVLTQGQITKEITVVVSDSELLKKPTWKGEGATDHLLDLTELHALDKKINATKAKTGVFSTGPAAVYTAVNLKEKLSCFVDEDPDKVGKYFLGVPVVSVSQFDRQNSLINPLPLHQFELVNRRYPELRFID